MSFDIYCRASEVGSRAGESFASPEEREAAARAWAEQAGVEVDEVVEELDVSGSLAADARELGRLIRRVETGESEGVIARMTAFSYPRAKDLGSDLEPSFGHPSNNRVDGSLSGDNVLLRSRLTFCAGEPTPRASAATAKLRRLFVHQETAVASTSQTLLTDPQIRFDR
jgi:hypothetical protein